MFDGQTLRAISALPTTSWINSDAYYRLLQYVGAIVMAHTTNVASVGATSNAVLSVDLGQNWQVANLTCATAIAIPRGKATGKTHASFDFGLFAH